MSELKPCPFCGGEANLERPHEGGIYVRHMCDFVEGVWFETEEEAIKAWNTRSIETENAELRERIHKLDMEGSDHFYRMAYAEDANRTLEAENAKLRELVRDMFCAWASRKEGE